MIYKENISPTYEKTIQIKYKNNEMFNITEILNQSFYFLSINFFNFFFTRIALKKN